MDWVHHLSHHQVRDEAQDLSGLALLRVAEDGAVTFRCVEWGLCQWVVLVPQLNLVLYGPGWRSTRTWDIHDRADEAIVYTSWSLSLGARNMAANEGCDAISRIFLRFYRSP